MLPKLIRNALTRIFSVVHPHDPKSDSITQQLELQFAILSKESDTNFPKGYLALHPLQILFLTISAFRSVYSLRSLTFSRLFKTRQLVHVISRTLEMGGGRKALKAVCLCGCCIYNYINQIHISIIKDVPEHLGVNFVC